MSLKQILSNDPERDEQFVKQIVEHCSSEMVNWLSDNRGTSYELLRNSAFYVILLRSVLSVAFHVV